MSALSDDTLHSIDERLSRIEKLLPSIQARLKTVERNAPLEVRLRNLEHRVESKPSSYSHQIFNPVGQAMFVFCRWLGCLWPSHFLMSIRSGYKASVLAEPHFCEPRTLAAPAVVDPRPVLYQGTGLEAQAAIATGIKSRPPEPRPLEASAVVDPTPIPSQSSGLEAQVAIRSLHREACASGKDTYKDPATGYDVFTSDYLRTRDCCGSGCRHCPWGHRNVPTRRLSVTAQTENIPKSTLYTRKGDTGWTNLYNEQWVLKSEPVYDAIGDVDELNSAVGFARTVLAEGLDAKISQQLEVLQGWLLDVGSSLCTPRNATQHARKLKRTHCITEEVVVDLETWIDQGDEALRMLRHFILPGGSPGGGALHLARTICRRAERHTWPLIVQGHADTVLGIFLNRLSDYLFVVARLDALASGSDEQEYGIESKVDHWQRQIHTGINKPKEPMVPLEPHRWHDTPSP